MRIGVVLLPEHRWTEAAPRWRAAEQAGFDHAWTYDHLAWRSLADGPWFATVPTLTAAATVTSGIRLGTWVASPNFRHPVPFAKELMTLDDISGGRFTLGVGAGGVGVDATVLGGEVLAPRERVDRLADFVGALDRLLTPSQSESSESSGIDWSGEYYRADQARMIPGCVQRPRLPFVVAANGPRTMRLAARYGQGWATTGAEGQDPGAWWRGVADLNRRFEDVCVDHGRDPSEVDRYLSLDVAEFALGSRDLFATSVGRAREAGFTDVVAHWPRPEGVYAGSQAVLDAVVSDLDALRAD